MKEILVTGRTLPEGYHKALMALYEQGDTVPCPDYHTEQKEVSMTMVIEEAAAEPMISKLFIGGYRELEQYRLEMLDGILDFEIEKGNWVYTYHSRMADQFSFILDDLRRNPDSRRAVIGVRDNLHDGDVQNDSPACLQHIQYFIREGKLHCKVLFRSNDAVKASFMNAFALICLQERFAKELGVPVGSYTHRANSYHVYERDYTLLSDYVSRIRQGGELCYDYRGEWDELMEEARPLIMRQVEELKER